MSNAGLLRWIAVVALSVSVAGCGGGGGGQPLDPALPPAPMRTIGGTVTGATNPLTLRNNSNMSTQVISVIGAYSFATEVPQGSSYDVIVSTPPNGQTCTVANGT